MTMEEIIQYEELQELKRIQRDRDNEPKSKDAFIDELNLILKNNFNFVPLNTTLKIAKELIDKNWVKVR